MGNQTAKLAGQLEEEEVPPPNGVKVRSALDMQPHLPAKSGMTWLA